MQTAVALLITDNVNKKAMDCQTKASGVLRVGE